MKIIALYNSQASCDYHRVYLPMRHMKLQDGDSIRRFTESDILREEDLEDADIVVFNRLPPFDEEKLLEFRKKLGFKIVMDLDDYWRLYPGHVLEHSFNSAKMPERIEKMAREADCVTVTNGCLGSYVESELKRGFEVLPNALPFGEDQFTDKRISKPGYTRFIYAGGNSHAKDFALISGLFKKIGKSKSGLEFVLAGYDMFSPTVMRMLSCMKPVDPYVISHLPLKEYMNMYMYADVSLAPLVDNKFNAAKSNLKVIEAGCKGIPVLVSEVEPYMDDILNCSGVLSCSSTKDWYDNIIDLSSPGSTAKRIGMELGSYVRSEYNLLDWNKKRYELYKSLL